MMKNAAFSFSVIFCLSVMAPAAMVAAPIVRQGSGANTPGLQAIVDQFTFSGYGVGTTGDVPAQGAAQ